MGEPLLAFWLAEMAGPRLYVAMTQDTHMWLVTAYVEQHEQHLAWSTMLDTGLRAPGKSS